MPELGHFSLVIAGCMALFGTVVGYAGAHQQVWARTTLSLAVGQFVFVGLAFVALVYAFVTDDFSVAYVANHSNSLLPWYYKISATWGGHEGSFLLWIMFLCGWMLLVAVRRHNYPQSLFVRVLATLSVLSLGFICFALFTSNPFERLIPLTPADGSDLNPLLQDFGLIVHPPMLYAGYVGLAVPFAFAIAGMLENRVDAAWARWTRPWSNAAWAFLTCGITLGSWWAYYELGWGGWWFWDPSENASFMPWLAATALVHAIAVTEKRGTFKSWSLLLAIAGFSLALLGGFIIRSGVLTSVHAFAVDPERGAYILLFLSIVVGTSLLLYAWRAANYASAVGYTWRSREFFMLANNALLMFGLAVVLWGTLAPIGYEAISGGKISLGPPFFNRFYVPLMIMLGLALVWVPLLNWKRTDWTRIKPVLLGSGIIAAGVVLLSWALLDAPSLWLGIALATAVWIVLTHAVDVFKRVRRKTAMPLAYAGMTLAHLGFAVSIAGVAVTSSFSVEKDIRMVPQSQAELSGYEVTFLGVSEVRGPNYVAQQGLFLVQSDGQLVAELRPEKRRYLAGGSIMTEAGIDPGLFADTYISMGEPLGDSAWAVRLHHKPLVRWVWLGALMMGIGGLLAIFDARYARLRRRQAQEISLRGEQPA